MLIRYFPFQLHHQRAMVGLSLDGRLRPSDMASLNGKHCKSKDTKTPSAKTQALRPASPPKINPWTKKRPATSLAPDWPSITPDFENINETTKTNKTKEAKDENQKRPDTKSSCPVDSKNDDKESPSRKIFQAAAPRAGDRFGKSVSIRSATIRLT